MGRRKSDFVGFLVLLISYFADAKFYPVDFGPFLEKGIPDPYRLSDPSYFRQWLNDWYNPYAAQIAQAQTQADWDYNTNVTNENDAAFVKSVQLRANFTKAAATMAKNFDISKIADEQLQRIHKSLTRLGDDVLPPDDLTELSSTVNRMTTIYSTATVCFNASQSVASLEAASANCPQSLRVTNPALLNYVRDAWDDPDKRKYVWKAWRNATGQVIRSDYIRYIALKNKAAQLSGYFDYGQLWRSDYVVDSLNYTDSVFLSDLERLWQQVKPLYMQLHAYVRRKLIQKFPNENISPTAAIPAHLLGDMLSQSWGGMLSFTQVFPSKALLDVTDEMRAQNYTVEEMFRISEKFQIDLGLMPMVDSFWNLSMLTKPTDRDAACDAAAYDFYSMSPPDDTRIRMCTQVNMADFITIHHEMGHIQYYMQYANQFPLTFRAGANNGFHEAVGDTLLLSVSTPKHLSWLGLLKNNVEDEEGDLNYQFVTAMEQISNLPFMYVMDKYRYDVFSGNISTDNLNAGWWKYVTDYQGIVPPVTRSEFDFDPAAKYHTDADIEYMRYFISVILMFQFHKGLCTAAGHTGPLYQCDINQSEAAGKRLSDMLSLGSSQPWPIALEKITGTRNMDAGAILEFFDPLYKYLQEVNTKNNEFIGWK